MRYVQSLLVGLIALTSVPGWTQTTTGRLMGTTVDESGALLSGAVVTVSSAALIGGAQVKTTDDKGEFLFLSLTPGDYTVQSACPGFITQERNMVKVPLGGAAVITIAMPMGAFSDEIEVVDETPVVDPTQINTGQIFRADYMLGSAVGSENRAYYTVINQTAGVARGRQYSGVPQSSVFGSTVGENAFFIDGMDATNPVMGTATTVLNFDAIGEIQLQTGGFEAEYGRATGGIINLVSKAGGNRFSGTFDARYRDDSLQENGDYFDAGELSTKHQVFGATLGGPILRDQVWFFASYERINDLDTPNGSPTTREQKGQNYLGKITWQIAPAWRLSGKYTSDPMTIDNWNASRWVMPEATNHNLGTTAILSAELTSVLSDALLWNTTLGTYDYESNVYPQSGDLATIGHHNLATSLDTENNVEQRYWETRRKDFSSDFTWFVDNLAGSHELKGGVEYSGSRFNGSRCSTGTPNGERCVPDGVGLSFYDSESGGAAIPLWMHEAHASGPTDSEGTVSTLFAQDAWRATRDLTVKIGLRYDAVAYDTNNGIQIADMDMLQPRLGFAWDLAGDAKNILRGSWGRFLHPNILALPYYVREVFEPSFWWYSCSGNSMESADQCMNLATGNGWDYRADPTGWDPYGWVLVPWQRYATEPNRADPNLRPTYADQLILAFEREVGARSAIELTFIDKKTRDVVDDTCNGNWPTPSVDAACDYFFTANIPELKRDYRGVTLRFETRRYAWLTLLTSYTYSSSEGSIEYHMGDGWEVNRYPWRYENIYGYLSYHRRHRIKLNGFFNIKGDWNIAFDARWSSPFTWTPYENSSDNPAIPGGSHFLEPRGSREGNSQHQIDLQLSKGFTAGRVRFVLIGTVLNALNSEQSTRVCEHISGCGSYEDGAPIDMGDPTEWQTPRRYEVGFRVEF